MTRPRRFRPAFSLIELFITVAVMGIVAGMAITYLQPTLHDHLPAAAQLITADLAYARSLSVANNSTYRITFDKRQNRYVLTHSGTNSLLDVLPPNPYRRSGDPVDQHITALDDLPGMSAGVRIVSVSALSNPIQEVADVEFGPLGETTRVEETVVWLAAGSGDAARYLGVHIDAVTGLATLGELRAHRPPALPQNLFPPS